MVIAILIGTAAGAATPIAVEYTAQRLAGAGHAEAVEIVRIAAGAGDLVENCTLAAISGTLIGAFAGIWMTI